MVRRYTSSVAAEEALKEQRKVLTAERIAGEAQPQPARPPSPQAPLSGCPEKCRLDEADACSAHSVGLVSERVLIPVV